jgi:succinate dehydrogenase/fumarate reductase flavoprotein subunit
MAAIKAREANIPVTLVDKGNTRRSGQAGSGIDHIWAWVPEVHGKMGWTLDDLIEDHAQGQGYGFINKGALQKVARESYNRVLDLEKMGIQFRYDDSELPGKWRIVPQFHSVPSSFNFDGRNIKPVMTRECERRGVNIINRVMMTDLIVLDGEICGALGVGTRTGDIYHFSAKSIVLSSGRSGRLTRNVTGTDFNVARQPGETGDGKLMALRAGCRLINMEFFGQRFLNVGPYQQSFGAPRSTTWPAGALVAANGKTIIPKSFFTNWGKYLGEGAKKIDAAQRRAKWLAAIKTWPSVMPMWERGEGPFYLDCTGGTEEEIKYVEWSIFHEGRGWQFLRHLEEEGLDLRKDKIEFTLNNAQMGGSASSGVWADDNLETGVKGLFVAGDEMGGFPWASSQGAVGTGWLTGDMAAKRAVTKKHFLPADPEQLEPLVASCSKILDSATGVHWKEMERALQDIVDFYRGRVITELTLKRGIERIQDLRQHVFLKAENPHELMRCLEAKAIVDNADLVLRATLERKESRKFPFDFFRTDFPEQDDKNFYAFLAMTLEKGEVKFSKIELV